MPKRTKTPKTTPAFSASSAPEGLVANFPKDSRKPQRLMTHLRTSMPICSRLLIRSTRPA